MAKGKFSQPRTHREDDPASKRPVQRPAAQEEAPSIDQVLQQAAGQEIDRTVAPAFPQITRQEEDQAIDPAFGREYGQEEDRAIEQAFQQITGEEAEPQEEKPSFAAGLGSALLNNKKVLLVVLCAVALVIIIGIIAAVCFSSASDPYGGRILNNVTIAGVNIGGMTRSEAIDAVKAVTDDTFTKEDMVIELSDTTLRLSPADTGAKLDVKAAVAEAYNYGRTGTKAEQQAAYQNAMTGNHIIGLLPYLNLDEAYIRSVLEDFAGQFGSTYVPSGYELEGEMPALEADKFDATVPCQTLVLTIGTPGFGLNIDDIYNQVLDAYSFNRFLVEAKDVETDATPEPLDLDAIYEELTIDPVDATVNMQTYETIPGTYGYRFDLDEAQKLLDEADYGDVLRISMEYIEPEIMDDNVLFRDVLGSCETPHTSNENRNTNLRLACAALDGLVLNPGETFSYNEALGQRTAEKGYKAAPAYSGLELVDSIGGGICQGSSTLYYCALLADLEIVDRTNHGFVPTYIDMGMDATVSWGAPDFKFKNNTNFPIKIQAEVSDGYVKMKILGTDEKDYYIKMEYEITGVDRADTIYVEHGPNEGYTDGQVLQKGGATGYWVKTYKCKYDKETDELISRDFEARSTYKSKDTIIVKIVDPKAPTETTPPETETPTEPEAPTEAPPAPTESTPPAPTESTPPPTESTPSPSPSEGEDGG